MPLCRRQSAHLTQIIDGANARTGRTIDAGVAQDYFRVQHIGDACHLRQGQGRSGGDRHQTDGQCPQIGQREVDGVSKAHQHHIARNQPQLQQPRSGTTHRSLKPGKAPILCPTGIHNGQSSLVAQTCRVLQYMGGHVERAGAGRIPF